MAHKRNGRKPRKRRRWQAQRVPVTYVSPRLGRLQPPGRGVVCFGDSTLTINRNGCITARASHGILFTDTTPSPAQPADAPARLPPMDQQRRLPRFLHGVLHFGRDVVAHVLALLIGYPIYHHLDDVPAGLGIVKHQVADFFRRLITSS